MKKDPVCLMLVDEATAVSSEHRGKMIYFCSEGCRDRYFSEHICEADRSSYELIVVGGGPAGLTASVYAALMRLDTFMIAKYLGGQAIDSRSIQNYMGFDFITGPELIEKFKDQLVHSHYVDHVIAEVEKIARASGGFLLTTSGLKRYSCRALIIATGMTRRTLDVPGEERLQRKGIFYGNIQDYSFVQGQDVAVVGGGNSAMQMAESLSTVAKTIHIVSDIELTADPKIAERVTGLRNVVRHENVKILSFEGEDVLDAVAFRPRGGAGEMRLPVKGAFIAIGMKPNSALVAGQAELNDEGEVVIGKDCSTSTPGLFAAGDVTDAFGKRIVIASGEGAKAALAARQYVLAARRARA